jgi:nucleotide-binding universal stress UspA family protein
VTAFHRILVGWDCSPGAAAALRAAASLAADDTVRVVALAVLKPASHAESREEGTADLDARREHAMKTFAEARDALTPDRRARVSLHFAESGDAARIVCEYAQQHGFDLLVLGRHGIGGILHPRLGHVTATAARTSSVPVLVAP